MCLFLQWRGCRSPAQLCRGWGRTFPEREPGPSRAPGVHVTPPPTPHFSRELPKPKPAQDRTGPHGESGDCALCKSTGQRGM